MKISICIPTLNRPQYLMEGIKSIYNQKHDSFDFEVCISNNASDADYSEVDDFIHACNLKYKNINYYIHKNRLPLDEHMHFVTKMASGDYIYYLGDDDFFQNDAFTRLSKLCSVDNVDLAIFNGTLVDGDGAVVGNHFKLPSRKYSQFSEAFMDLRDKGMFGAVLVKKEHIRDDLFSALYGSSHAYGCFWLAMLNNPERQYAIEIPDFPCVFLRVARKNYNVISVYYKDIPLEFELYRQLITSNEGRNLNELVWTQYKKKICSLMFMIAMFSQGGKCKDLNAGRGMLFSTKRAVAYICASNVIYPLLKKIYRFINR
jgi:abequosyltransferase